MADSLPITARGQVAYHEAGHAVMCWHLGHRRVTEVLLTPGNPEHAGLCRYGPCLISDRFQQAVNDILIHCAGRAAEAALTGRMPDRPPASDGEKALELARRLTYGGPDARPILAELDARARRLVASPALWPAVELVAGALLKAGRLDGAQVEQLCRTAGAKQKAAAELKGRTTSFVISQSSSSLTAPYRNRPR